MKPRAELRVLSVLVPEGYLYIKICGEVETKTLKEACFGWSIPKAPIAFKNPMIHGFCNSHCLSHFAAFFIVMGTKISIVKNLVLVNIMTLD